MSYRTQPPPTTSTTNTTLVTIESVTHHQPFTQKDPIRERERIIRKAIDF